MGRQGSPVLGDKVYIGTGATLVGKIKIGSGAEKIAANTLRHHQRPGRAPRSWAFLGRIIMRPPRTCPGDGTSLHEAETTVMQNDLDRQELRRTIKEAAASKDVGCGCSDTAELLLAASDKPADAMFCASTFATVADAFEDAARVQSPQDLRRPLCHA